MIAFKQFNEIKAPVSYLPSERFAKLKINAKHDYLISTRGRIYSYYSDKIVNGRLTCGVLVFEFTPKDKNTALPYSNREGNMVPSKSGRIGVTVQKLVAFTFLQKPKGRSVVLHTSYNKLDNGVDNIAWVKIGEPGKDVRHLYKLYTVKKWKGNKLDGTKVLEIKELLWQKRAGELQITIEDIAKKYKIASMQVYRIQCGALWNHVGEIVKEKQVNKITPRATVIKIKQLLKKGLQGRVIAERLHVTTAVVSRIKTNKYHRSI